MASRMYSDYFGLKESAFSITPDPRYLYMSERHCEALAHLLYGVVESGCFVMLTGEVGTGKTTVCRTLLEQLPERVDVALLLDPPRSGRELLLAIIDELRIPLRHREAPLRELVDHLNQHLLANHAAGRTTVVIIDEAQNISPEVLEQVRLLTNLETATAKLLQVILVGQPELRQQLADPSLRQVAQRITARYHLHPLTAAETQDYVHHRLTVAGCRTGLFTRGALRQLHRESQGVPRVINILCDRALLGAFANDLAQVGRREVCNAAHSWRDELRRPPDWHRWRRLLLPLSGSALLVAAGLLFVYQAGGGVATATAAVAQQTPMPAPVPSRALLGVAELATVEERLLQLWGVTAGASAEGLCSVATRYSLECMQGTGRWESLHHYNRPALLTLNQQGVRYALLERLDDTTATLVTAQGSISLSREELMRYWSGEFRLLWRPDPLLQQQTIGPDSPPHLLHWLSAALDRFEGRRVSDAEAVRYDEQMRERIRSVQRSHGLVPDGIAGPRTLSRLQAVNDTSPGPRLHTPSPLS